MAKINLKSKKMWKDILVITLSCIAIVGVFFGIFAVSEKLDEQTTRTIHPSYGIGGLTEDGKYLETENSIYTRNAFECQGLNIKLAFANTITYRVYFYGPNEKFMTSTDDRADAFTSDEIPVNAQYCRIVITPNEDEKISLLELNSYSSQLTISVNKEQKYTQANLFVVDETKIGKDWSKDSSTLEFIETTSANYSYIKIDVTNIDKLVFVYNKGLSKQYSNAFFDANNKLVSLFDTPAGEYEYYVNVPENAAYLCVTYKIGDEFVINQVF